MKGAQSIGEHKVVLLARRTSAKSMHPSFTLRPLRLRNTLERDSVAASVPVQLCTRIVGLIAIQIGGQ